MIAIDTIILFPLLTTFVMNFRIGPGDTPYWLFGIIFLLLLIYILLDLTYVKSFDGRYAIAKKTILCILISITIGSSLFSEIIVRHQSSPIYHVHDIILQQEAAIRLLLHGKNPYTASYFDTPMAQWHYSDTEVNPALYHFVMQPFYLIFAVPFYIVMSRTVGFFDARMPLLFLFIVMLIVAQKIPKLERNKRLLVILFAFNPATLGYFIEGRDDIFMFAFLLIGFFLLQKSKYIPASIFMAFAFAVKQSAWPLFPFYFFYLWLKEKKFSSIIKQLCLFGVVFFGIITPFFVWNPQGFIESTILYLSGNVQHSYPIAGYGLGMLLHQTGIIPNIHAYYPFWIWQILFALPVLIMLVFWLKRECTLRKMILSYGIFLFIFWYCSRYFNNSHVGYLSMIFILAYFFPEKSTTLDQVHS